MEDLSEVVEFVTTILSIYLMFCYSYYNEICGNHFSSLFWSNISYEYNMETSFTILQKKKESRLLASKWNFL